MFKYQQAECDDFPHIVIYGPTGAGKRTRINCILKAIYGPGASNTRINIVRQHLYIYLCVFYIYIYIYIFLYKI